MSLPRTATALTHATTQPTPSGAGWARRGSSIFDGAARAAEEAQQRRSGTKNVQRFWLKKGEECPIVILDQEIESGIAFWEHSLQGPDGKWDDHRPCLKDLGVPCPLCKQGDNSSYVIFLSALVLRPFTTKKGTHVPHSKKLLPIRITQIDLFRQLENAARSEGKGLRGMFLIMRRPLGESNSPRIGEPSILEGGKLYGILSEQELQQHFGHEAMLREDGSVMRPANFDITPYDYDALFPRPDIAQVLQQQAPAAPRSPAQFRIPSAAPVAPAAGSAAEVASEFAPAEQQQGAPVVGVPSFFPALQNAPAPAAQEASDTPPIGGVRQRRRASASPTNDPFA